MCWNAPVSFATFAGGSLLNLLSYWALSRRGSLVAPLVWAWQYALLMQIPEGIVWARLDAGVTSSSIQVESRVAFFLNITQPLSLYVAIRSLRIKLRYAQVALFMYFLLLVVDLPEYWERTGSIAPSDGCDHINLGYWNPSRGFLYVFAALFVISELPSPYWVTVNSAIFLLSLLFAAIFYNCGLGSMWCWLIWTAGPLLVLADVAKALVERATWTSEVASHGTSAAPRASRTAWRATHARELWTHRSSV